MDFPETPARKVLFGGTSMADDAGPGFDLDGAVRFFSVLWELIKVKAPELMTFFPGLLCALSRKADDLFPPDTRDLWLYVAATEVIPAALGTLTLLCLARCCWRCYCAGASRGGGGRMRRGRCRARMPRDAFKEDPMQCYFRDLRGGKPLECY